MLCKGAPAIYAEGVRVGALATITLIGEAFLNVSSIFPAPVTNLIPPDFAKVESYVNSTRSGMRVSSNK